MSTSANFSSPQAVIQQAMEQPTPSPITFSWKRNGGGVVLTNEWRGYRSAAEVLRPFGYAPSFVELVVSTLRRRFPRGRDTADVSHNDDDDAEEYDEEDAYAHASFAVRGVTVARPESYCLCVDRTWGPRHMGESRLQRLQDRKDLRRTVLPRVIHRNGGLPPAVQFLNVDKSSAVTLMTPALACGTLREPFTIFLVGIATEDGCFLSGLRHRFEIGHLYPRDQLEEVTESSAICILTEDWSQAGDRRDDGDAAAAVEAEGRDDEDMGDMESVEDEIWPSGDDDNMSNGSAKCTCVFQGVTEKLDVLEEHDEAEGRLMRGALGPGSWHCYTVIVDGHSTKFRIDGIEEPVFSKGRTEATAYLDGLTLGADHCFGMSLCSGQGSPGEGEGAIAELAVFSGVMAWRDVETMEKHFMTKHGIPFPAAEPWKEDDFYRQAHAMFQLTGNPRGHRVPLRYFTRSPNVAWTAHNPVTRERLRRARIGARSDDSSSEW